MASQAAVLLLLVAARPAAAGPASKDRAGDAAVDRGLFGSHAQTQPAGHWAVNVYDLVAGGFTFAPTDRFQASVTTPPLPFAGVVHFKGVAFRGERVVLTAAGDLAWMPDGTRFAGVGPLLDVYAGGHVSLHAGAQHHLASAADEEFVDGDNSPTEGDLDDLTVVDAGVTLHAADAKWLGEVKVLVSPTRDVVVLAGGGVRFHGPTFALDLGLLLGVPPGGEDVLVPLLALSWRP